MSGRTLISASLLFTACALTGCSGDDTVRSIRANPTPELDTLYQRPVDIDNKLALTWDENWRMFNQDLGRALLLNRPSRLTPEPIPQR